MLLLLMLKRSTNRAARQIIRCACLLSAGMFSLAACASKPANAVELYSTPVALPGGLGGIGFDDLIYSPQLKRVIAPAGRTGSLDLVNPQTLEVTAIAGFSAQGQFGGGHGEGTTSADFGRGVLFAIDRTAMRLDVVDPASQAIVAFAAVSANPDYVRFVESAGQVWVTEPDSEQIEVFSLAAGAAPRLTQAGLIHVSGGPESLVIDSVRKKAYTHLWNGMTVVIDLQTRELAATWKNGCIGGSRGIALDEARGFLFAGCYEGKAVVLDIDHDGRQLSSFSYGLGVDVISYNPRLGHLYLPAAVSASMAILNVSPAGEISLAGTVSTAGDAHCVTADELDNAWVCDPSNGRLLLVKDTLPPAQ